MPRSDNTRIRLAILRVLAEADEPLGATRIADRLLHAGVRLQPRTVRFHLVALDREELSRFVSRRRGRVITENGRRELEQADVVAKVGFVRAKVDTLGYRMAYREETGEGTVIANFSMIQARDLSRAFAELKPVFDAGLGMGELLCLSRSGRTLAGRIVPGGRVALGTLCSVTLNGVLMAAGIPISSRYGGLVEMRGGHPVRFVELMDYAGTTIDPIDIYVRAGMTRVRDCAATGSGVITASFRDIPSVALDDARRLFKRLERKGLGGVLLIGHPGQPLLDIPVAEGRTGLLVVGGLNPIAALVEAGIECELQSLSGLEDISLFIRHDDCLRGHMNALRS